MAMLPMHTQIKEMKDMKKIFETPVMDVIHFTVEDLMAGGISVTNPGGGGGITTPVDEWDD